MATKLDIATAVQMSVGETPTCWGIAQSLESRYSAAASTASVGGMLGGALLARRARQATLPDAVVLPRLFVMAVTQRAVYFFERPLDAPHAPVASVLLAGATVEIHRGLFWTRVVLHGGDPARSYVAYFSRMAKGRQEITDALAPLAVAA